MIHRLRDTQDFAFPFSLNKNSDTAYSDTQRKKESEKKGTKAKLLNWFAFLFF